MYKATVDAWAKMGWLERAIATLAVAMALFHLIASSPFILMPNLLLRGIHLLFAMIIGFLLFSLHKGRVGNWLDAFFIVLSFVCVGYLVINHTAIEIRPAWTLDASPLEIAVTVGTIVALIELTRRAVGGAVAALCVAFIIYGFIGPYLRYADFLRPIAHRGVSLDQFVDQMYFSYEGIFGVSLGVSTDFIFLFVVFGSILQAIGGGDFFINVTRGVAGATRGGPAKMAVIASALMGSISGSSVANVVTTGSLTIPMMIKLGYKRSFAGAVEAVASTGGQITPPIMGAAAFLMAAIVGVDYLTVAKAAAVPSILFYVALLIAVHCEAVRQNLSALEKAAKGETARAFRAGWTYLIPLCGLMALMIYGYTPTYSAFFGVFLVLVTPYFRRSTFVSPLVLLRGLREGAEGAVVVAIACASAGIIVGIVQISGLGFRFSSLVVDIAGGSLYIALILAMIAGFIFGMGLPTTPAYIIQATLIAPALIDLGASPLSSHLFVFYYAVLGQITPPVAVAAYAAAPIAGVSAGAVGWRACLLGIPVYIIPFIFVLNPELMLLDASWSLLPTIIRSIISIACLSMAAVGWRSVGKAIFLWRFLLAAAAALIIVPYLWTDMMGAGLIIIAWLGQKYFNGKPTGSSVRHG